MNPFKAFVIDQDENRKVVSRMGTLAAEQLDAGEVTIRVHYSSINYKDALAATGAMVSGSPGGPVAVAQLTRANGERR